MKATSLAFRFAPAAIVMMFLAASGCAQKKVADQPGAKKNSQVQVIAPSTNDESWMIRTSTAQFEFTKDGSLHASLLKDGKSLSIDSPLTTADEIQINGKAVTDFVMQGSPKISAANGKLGDVGKRIELVTKSPATGLERAVAVEVYDAFPNFAVVSTSYKNAGQSEVKLDRVLAQRHEIDASLADANAKPYQMWSFQGSSIDWGKDEILPISAGYKQQNVMGAPVNQGHGGGVPVNAFWTRNVGLAIGHLETIPLVLDMPVQVGKDQRVQTAIKINDPGSLRPGDNLALPRTFVAVYAGDFYEPLRMYSLALQKEGWTLPKPNAQDYGIAWCGWGYQFNVTPKQMTNTIPKLKELGINWATLDDRWFDTYGDWNPRKDTFPDDSIKKMVQDFHQQGIKAQIWWYPLVVEDGKGRWESHKYVVADVVKQHPDWLIQDKDGKNGRSMRDLGTLCPALPEVQEYTKKMTEKFIKDWDFDGHKLDNIYSVPACYNPKHHHKSPQDSINAMADIYKIIFQTTRALKPDSVTQICPCGTTPNFAWLPFMDQAVTADPVGGVQVRRRIKWYKALLGPDAAVYGDHVELSEMSRVGKDNWREHGQDFASTLGTGGVLGTKFTWPNNNPKFKDVALTPDKEAHWKKWASLYNEKMLSKGQFRDLYIYGYDNPEGYAIEKDGTMYYAFFARDPQTSYQGSIELRGLAAGKYRVVDYVNNKQLGEIDGANPKFDTSFTGHLLVQAMKE
jgi:alpha-galactosidase